MTWPRFGYRLCICACIALLCGTRFVLADGDFAMETYGRQIAQEKDKKQTVGAKKGKVTTDGACDFDDDAKKKMAQEAQNAMIEATHALIEYNKQIMKHFEDKDGSCHYLNTQWGNDANPQDLRFNDYATAGAKACNDLNRNSTTLNKLDEFNQKIGHAGVDLRKLIRRATTGNTEGNKMVQWSQTAQKGSIFKINESTSELLEEAFDYKLDCKYAIMTDNAGSFQCIQGTSDVDTDRLQELINKGLEKDKDKDISAFSFQVAFSCTKTKCSKGNGSFSDIINSLSAKAQECKEIVEQIVPKRAELIEKRKKAHQLLDILSGNLDVMCTCEMHEIDGEMEATGKVQTCVATDPEFIEDNMNECPTIAEYQIKMTGTNGEHCIICNLFHTILKAVQNLAQKAYDALAPSLISLLGIGFGIYIGYITLLAVATPGVQKISQYLTNLTTQGFKVAIAIILLSTPSFIYGTIIGPMIDGGVDFGITLAGSDKAQIQEMGSKFDFDAGNTYLQTSVLQNTIGAAVAFNQQAAMVPAIGRSMMCNSWYNDESLIEKISKAHFFPRIPLFTEGLILYIFGLMIAFAVGFYMIDCALQLGVVCAMMPFFVASWPFKITKSYTKQGWDIFLNTFFNFVVMGVVISATSQIMVEALGTGLSQQTLSSLLDTNQVDELMNEIEFGGLQMAMLVICCLLALKLSGEIQNITNKLSGGLGISVGAGLGGALGTSIQKGTMAAAGAAGVAAVATGGRIAESSGIAGAVRSMKGDAKDTATAAAGVAGMGSQARQSSSKSRDHGQQTQFGAGAENNDSPENDESAGETNEESEDNNSE